MSSSEFAEDDEDNFGLVSIAAARGVTCVTGARRQGAGKMHFQGIAPDDDDFNEEKNNSSPIIKISHISVIYKSYISHISVICQS